jgi:signal peptidase I
MRAVLRVVERVLAIVGLFFIVFHGAFRLSRLASGSMQPTLMGRSLTDGDVVLSETLTGRWRRPRRFEVVGFQDWNGVQIMKRVIGLPGESVALAGGRPGRPVVDGKVLEIPRGVPERTYYAYGNLANGLSSRCGSGFYVLGDDSQDSQDSRFDGPIRPDRILGRALLIVWPLSRFGFVR